MTSQMRIQDYKKKQMSKSSVRLQFIPYLIEAHIYLAHLQKNWQSLVYICLLSPRGENKVHRRRVHNFTCAAKNCKGKGANSQMVCHYLDTGDRSSTSGLCHYTVVCWGEEIVKEACATKNIKMARDGLKGAELKNGSMTAVFERIGKGKVTYSHRQHTKAETW